MRRKKALVPKLFFETKAEDASAVPLKLRRPHGPPPLTGPNSPFALTRRLRRALTRRAPPRTPGSGAIGAGGLRRRFAPNTGSLRVSASVPLRHRFEGYYKRPWRFCQPLLREEAGFRTNDHPTFFRGSARETSQSNESFSERTSCFLCDNLSAT